MNTSASMEKHFSRGHDMSDDKTDPGIKRFTERTDPIADRVLVWAAGRPYTPWLIVGWTLLCVAFGWWVAK